MNFLFYLIVARALSPAGFGEVRYTITLATVALGLTQVLANVASRELGAVRADPERTGQVLGTTLAVAAALWFASSLLSLVASAAGLTGSARPLGLVAALSGLTAFQLYYQAARGVGEAGRAALTYMGCASVNLAAFAVLWAALEPTPTMALLVFGTSSMFTIGAFEFVRPIVVRHRLSVRRRTVGALWVVGGPLILAQAGYLAWNSADQIWVQTQLGTREVGLYSAARNLSLLLVVIPSGVVGVLLPRVAELVAAGEERRATRLTYGAAGGTVAATGCIALMLLVARKPLLSALYGGEYETAAPALVALSVAVVLYAGFVVLATAAVGWGRPRVFAVGVGVAAVAELLVLFTTDSESSSAAAWAYAGSIGLALAVTVVWLRLRPFVRPRGGPGKVGSG